MVGAPALLVIILLAILTVAPVQATAPSEAPREPSVIPISDSVLRDLTDDPRAPHATANVAVEVYGPDLDSVATVVAAVDGEVYGSVPGHFLAARISADRLETVATDPRVSRVKRLTRTNAGEPTPVGLAASVALSAVIEESMQLHDWHDAGYRGAGQKIGILDTFGADDLAEAIADGRVPQPAGAFCLRRGEPCSITENRRGPHGVGVAEIIHATAPEADLYFATVFTLSDLTAAVDWFEAQGVTIINRSETSEFDGPGDGTGPVGSLVDRAIEAGMVWVSAAGNAAGSEPGGGQQGENWIGEFTDTNGNGIHEWADGTERMQFGCGFLLGMRWDDWDPLSTATDYDLAIYDSVNGPTPRVWGNDLQATPADPPLEHVDTRCKFPGDADYLEIRRSADLEPDGPDTIQIMGNFTPLTEWVNPGSATGPGADSANPGAVTVGATRAPDSFVRAWYSSQGPTTDGRMNPDLIGPSCLPVPGFGPPGSCFTGTSASSPFVAGVLAVLRDANVYTAAPEVEAIIPLITVDQGPPGPDSLYGHGALSMPPPSALGIVPTSSLCFGLNPTISGTEGDDILEGTDGVDVIAGLGGNDVITGRGAGDVICGGDGRDLIRGGGGPDQIDGGDDKDRIWGERGADLIFGGSGADHIFGNVGFDELRGEGGNDRVVGGAGDDETRGGAGKDRLIGGPGADFLVGGAAVDACFGAGVGEPAEADDNLSRCER